MSTADSFPESAQKAYLRRQDLQILARQKAAVRHDLAYLGLPAGRMLDIQMWRGVLGHITAVERDPQTALRLLRTAEDIGVRDKTILVEMGLVELAKLLAEDDAQAGRSLADYPQATQRDIRKIRAIQPDVFNLDFCGGLLYGNGESENAAMLRHLIEFQARYKNPFTLITTLQLRDTGANDYDDFMSSILDALAAQDVNVYETRKYYLAKKIAGQPRHLRRLRLCIPAYTLKVAFEYFQLVNIRAWSYKTFYHASLSFEPRPSAGALGRAPWPPLGEFRAILDAPLTHVAVDPDGRIVLADLAAPALL